MTALFLPACPRGLCGMASFLVTAQARCMVWTHLTSVVLTSVHAPLSGLFPPFGKCQERGCEHPRKVLAGAPVFILGAPTSRGSAGPHGDCVTRRGSTCPLSAAAAPSRGARRLRGVLAPPHPPWHPPWRFLSSLPPSFLPSFLPPSFLPSLRPSFLPSLLGITCSRVSKLSDVS